jgi:hypothetical protein
MQGLLRMFVLPTLLLRDAWRCLAFERSRAPSFAHAVRAWLAGQAQRARRLWRLGPVVAAELWSTEWSCARAGLAVDRGESLPPGACAPWHLPESALRDAPAAWLLHPLVDTGTAPWAPAPANGVSVLGAHLDAASGTSVWGRVPICGRDARPPTDARLAVVLHLYYPELWPEIYIALQGLSEAWDLFITAPAFATSPCIREIAATVPRVRFLPALNHGRDVLPWLRLLDTGELDGYEWVCKLHTKRSPHLSDGGRWRQQLLTGLLGEPGGSSTVLASLRVQPQAGVAGVAATLISPEHPRWAGSSAVAVRRVRRQLGLPEAGPRDPYFAGTMFWFRPCAVGHLKGLARQPALFEPEFGQVDGTSAHAVERLVVTVARAEGFGPYMIEG